MNVIDILTERGFIEARTHLEELDGYVQEGPATCYVGFDPTASSLHIGHLVPIMALAHMQREGHRPIALVGGGTGLVGDPSGKTEMRKILGSDEIERNALALKGQLSRFIDFQDQRAILLNNADWLTRLEYIPFLRDIGRHFSVNKMIKAESYRMRLDSDEGLSFIEFNYMLLQAYDFLELFDQHRCRLQMGGSDQWGNILAGIELIRKARQQTAFGLTFQLITTSSGAKMGKTAAGAVWLDAERTSPYEYYQYWINTDDQDVARFLALYTFLPISEIQEIAELSGADLNLAKAVLAFETTQLVHGREKAIQAMQGAAVMFGARAIPGGILPSSTIPRASDSMLEEAAVPQTFWETDELDRGVPLFKALHMVGLANSGGAARRLIQQGGAYVNGSRIDTAEYVLTTKDAQNHQILLRSGKKKFHKIILRP